MTTKTPDAELVARLLHTARLYQDTGHGEDAREAADRVLADIRLVGRLQHTVAALSSRVAELEAENVRLKAQTFYARAKSKRAGRNLLREEADAAMPYFTPQWEPLKIIADRAGVKNAHWLVSRARDLQSRGLVESRWIGAERTSSFKEWRLKGRPVAILASGPTPLPHWPTIAALANRPTERN